jgi:hypothetical protein
VLDEVHAPRRVQLQDGVVVRLTGRVIGHAVRIVAPAPTHGQTQTRPHINTAHE